MARTIPDELSMDEILAAFAGRIYRPVGANVERLGRAGWSRSSGGIDTARFRKHLLAKILEGDLTPEEKNFYYGWRKALETNP